MPHTNEVKCKECQFEQGEHSQACSKYVEFVDEVKDWEKGKCWCGDDFGKCPHVESKDDKETLDGFVSFIRPFKNRAYTKSTAIEIEKRVRHLLSLSKQSGVEEVLRVAEGMRPDKCDCAGAVYECEHWGAHELIDKIISKFKSNK